MVYACVIHTVSTKTRGRVRFTGGNSLTVGVGLLVGVPGIDEAGGAVVFVLQLHVETRRLAECAAGSFGQRREDRDRKA